MKSYALRLPSRQEGGLLPPPPAPGRKPITRYFACAAIAVLAAVGGRADLIRVTFQGSVNGFVADDAQGSLQQVFALGDVLTGSFVFDSLSPDTAPENPCEGWYEAIGPLSFSLARPSTGETVYTGSSSDGGLIGVSLDLWDSDLYRVFLHPGNSHLSGAAIGGCDLESFYFVAAGPPGTFSSDALPVVLPQLDAFCYGRGVQTRWQRYEGEGVWTSLILQTDLTTLEAAPADDQPPIVTASPNPSLLWPPNGKVVPVTVSGLVTDLLSGVNTGSGAYTVADSYGLVQPSGTFTIGADGTYRFTVALEARRGGQDKTGRTYAITVSARDGAGNVGSATVVVAVPHNR